MIKYRLKKNLPCAKAGEIFRQDFDKNDNNNVYMFQESYGIKQHKICLEDIDNFDEWFEEVEDVEIPDEFYIPAVYSDKRKIEAVKVNDIVSSSSVLRTIFLNNSEIGSAFKNKEEAERYIEYLKAKAIIGQDTKGFKPNWNDNSEIKYFGYLHFEKIEFGITAKENKFGRERMNKTTTIYFQSEEDIKDSFEKHYKEWNTYLTYEQ